jgi:hypothetical protein
VAQTREAGKAKSPGLWGVLFVCAMVEHPAGYVPLLALLHGEGEEAFRSCSTLGIREKPRTTSVTPVCT